ncbi:ABC transporter ATP-binding protein [Desulfovibrio aminophilus]|nr:ABC transporter ATP-binding protein [Desulfovibrio aminophilus]
MIRLENVSVGHGDRVVLRDLNLAVEPGELVGLLGPNGSGKTTLLLTLAGALPPLAGRVTLAGHPLEALRPRERARLAASVPQHAEPPGLKVLSVVLMGRYARVSFLGGYTDEDRAKALDALEETGGEALADRRADEISGGEWRRVLMARALVQEADLLLLDEAASGLDPARQAEAAELLLRRNAAGLTAVSAIHDLNLAALTCRRLIFLKNGRVALDGPVHDVFTETHLSEIYETRILVSRHPLLGLPQAHLAPGAGPLPHGASGPGRTR